MKSVLLCTILQCSLLSALASGPAKQPVDYVDPNIGTIGQLLTATVPYVQLPFGMARVAAVTTPKIQDRYLADQIYGFTAGAASVMVSTGEPQVTDEEFASDFDHDFETATPYYYAVNLDTWHTRAELTATQHAAIYRFTLPKSQQGNVKISLDQKAELTVVSPVAVQGSKRVTGTVATVANLSKETRIFFYAQFSRPIPIYKTWSNGTLVQASSQHGDHVGFVGTFAPTEGKPLEVRVGISYISPEQAHRNLEEETAGKSFDALRESNRELWGRALGAVNTTGGTEKERAIFYTALWRSLGRMTDITEDGHYYSGYDHQVHDANGHHFYVDDGLWDTFRSLHPLQLLLDAPRQEDMVRSYLLMYQQSGWLPSFPSSAGEQAVMIGHHAAEFILDTYAKGYQDFDVNLAYEALKKNATEATLIPWSRSRLTSIDRVYFNKGFFPALAPGEHETVAEVTPERRQAVSVTLENAYDDWAVSKFARALGKEKDAAYFGKLAQNYKNVWNPAIGFMSPRTADGEWISNFDPKRGGGQGGRDYTTEMNSWVYTFSVQHDPEGLIELMGGRDKFNGRLDQLFREQYGTAKFAFLGQFPDATGLVGLYAQGNEPSFHIPYLYDFSGQPWKTQKRVRQLMEVWYGDGPLGIPGDDDGGETSSWYVLSAMGFYPVCPGSPIYEIGSPIFERSAITMANGATFTIVADHVSAQNKYIQSATLNGKPWNKPWFSHVNIANGGTLVLQMGSEPNRSWGNRFEDAPPSMTPVRVVNP